MQQAAELMCFGLCSAASWVQPTCIYQSLKHQMSSYPCWNFQRLWSKTYIMFHIPLSISRLKRKVYETWYEEKINKTLDMQVFLEEFEM